MGTLVTLELPAGSPVLALPWIITFGPLSDGEEWEPVVCGPYEHAHAMALAESVVADEELMAVVEPLQPNVSIDQIRGDIAAARLAATDDDEPDFPDDGEPDFSDDGYAPTGNGYAPTDGEALTLIEPTPPPSPQQVRAGFARIAARLTDG